MQQKFLLAISIIGLACLGAVGCQHATDSEPGGASVDTVDQASETQVLFRAETTDGSGYLHFGFHPDEGWTFVKQATPLDTIEISPEAAKLGATEELKDGLRTAVQPQGQSGQNGQPGQSGSTEDDDFFGGFGGDSGAAGPRFSAATTFGQRFSANSPSSSPGSFTYRSPGATGGGSGVYTGSSGTNSRYSASASYGAGQTCSLRSLCDFSQAVCEVLPSAFESTEDASFSCGAISQCYSYIDRAAAQAAADLSRRQVCQVSSLFSCAADTIRQVRPRVSSADEGAFAILGSLFVCFDRIGLENEFSSESN
jgi:hypothetical protein